MKKILKISGIAAIVIAVATLLSVGAFLLIRYNNLVRTGNVLGVSWYSEGGKEFTISTVKELEEFVALSDFYTFEGQTIKLDADLTLNEGNAEEWKNNAPKNRWKPIQDFNGTFEGQGHTISGLYGKAHETPMAMFYNAGENAVVRNLKLVNGYMTTKGHSGTASFVVNGGGTFEKLYSDMIIDHDGGKVAGISSGNSKAMTISECWFDGVINVSLTTVGGIVDTVTKGNTVINHSLFSGTINATQKTFDNAALYIGGICGSVRPGSTVKSITGVTISDCLSSGTINCETQTSVGSVIGYVLYGGLAKAVFKNSYAAARIADQAYGATTGSITGKNITMRDQELTGIKAYQWTTLDFDRYWAPVEDGTPVLKYFAENPISTEGVEKEYDTSWYNPGEYVFEIHDRKDLYGLALLSASDSFKDKRVKLCADIVLNEGKAKDWEKNEPELPWIPIFDFNGMFDGQGHTVSGIYLKNAVQYQGFFTTVQTAGVIKDLSIKNSYFCNTNETLSMIGSIAGDFRGKLDGVYSNAIVVAYGPQVGGLIARANDNDDPGTNKADTITLTNCWFDGEVFIKGETSTYAAGLVSAVIQGDLLVEHCLNTGTIHSECTGRAIHVAGLVGSVSHVEARLVMKDCLNAGKIDAAYDVGVGSVVGRLSQEKHSADITNTYTTEESHINTIGTSSGTIKGGAIRIPESMMTGKNGYRYTTLDFENYWTTVSNDTPVLRKFAKTTQSTAGLSKAIDISWYNETSKTFTLKNLKQFYGFAFLATGNNFEGKTVKLGADITVNTPNVAAWRNGTATPSNPWVSIGNAGKEFNGTFDGQGHTIRGIYVKSDVQWTGLFGRASYDSVIKNFKLTDSYFCNTNKELCMTGSIAGEIRGRMENVYSNAVVEGYGPQIAGMVARINDYDDYKRETKAEIADKVVVKNCWFDGEVRLIGSQNTYAGGVLGCLVQGDLEMTDCLNSGKVISEKNDTTNGITLHVGGVLGSQSHAESRLVMSNCLNVGPIVTEPGMGTAAGALLGRVSGADHTATIKNSFATKESYANIVGYSNGIVNGTSYVDGGKNDTAGTKVNRTQIVLRTDAEVKAFFGPTTNAWTCDTINNGYDRGTPILKYFASWWLKQQPATQETSDTSWYNTTDTEFEISTAEQLNGMAELSAKYNFAGQTFKLTEDIQVNDVDDATLKAWEDGTKVPSSVWAPIGSTEVPFAGTFDGQGHTISGVYMNTNANAAGLFGATEATASFKNFKLVDSFLSSSGTQLGGIVGIGAFASMENIYVNATVKTTNSYAGGFVGQIKPAEETTLISNCWFDGEMIQVGGNVHSVGGFIGNDATATSIIFKNCLMSGPVSGGFRVGGFIGWKNNYAINEFHNCLSVGTVTSHPAESYEQYAEPGSYYGHHNTSTYNVKFYNSYASGDRITGVYKNESEAANYEISAYLKDRETLIATGEKTLFPALSGESKNAWVDDIGQNDTDRGTPILEMFADDWFVENPSTGLDTMPESKTDAEWYNETDTTFTITTVEEFLGFAELVNAGTDDFAGKTVKLGADITLNNVDEDILLAWVEGTEVPEVEWVPVGTKAKPFAGTFDGQGHEIKGLYLNTVVDNAGLFGNTVDSAVIKDFKLTYSYLSSKGVALGGIVGYGMFESLSDIYSNAIVYTTNSYVGGFVGQINKGTSTKTAQIQNCWFDGAVLQDNSESHSAGGFIGNDGVATPVIFKNCLSYGIVIGGYRVGGFYGWKNNYSVNEYYNCLSASTVGSTSTNESYAKMVGSYFGNYNTSTWNLKLVNSYALGAPLTGVYSDKDGPGKFENDTYLKDRMTVIETGEKKLFPALEGESKNAWVNDIGYNDTDRGTPVLEKFAEWWFAENPATGLEEMPGTKADTSWYSDTATEFTISTVQQLLGFAQLTSDGKSFAGQTVKLGADIKVNDVTDQIFNTWVSGTDVADIEWLPIGTAGTPFAGTFDGQGHTISGLYLNTTTEGAGFFGRTSETAVLKNFKLVDSYMTSSASALGLVGKGNFASIENVYSNAVMRTTAADVGGFIGTITAGTTTNVIKNCWFDGEILQTGNGIYNVGGFIGSDNGAVPIKFVNCLMTGDVTGVDNVGGFYGFHSYYAVRDYYNCLSVGTVVGTANGAYAGGVVGNVNTSTWNVKMYNTYTDATTVIYRTKTASEVDKYNIDTYLKTRTYLIETDEAELFPVLTAEGETENAWVNDVGYNATDRGTPILAYFADWWLAENPDDGLTDRPTADPSVDTSWYNETDTEFVLMDAADLLGFAKLGSEGTTFAGKTVKLGADIALNEVDATILETWKDGSVTPENVWTPVGTSANPFAGTFDGQGYEISGLYYNGTGSRVGLFGSTNDQSELKNIKVVDSYFKTTGDLAGAVAAETNAHTLENLYSNAYVSANSIVGGLIGRLVGQSGGSWTDYYSTGAGTKWTVKKAWFDGEVVTTSGKHYFGGIVGNLPNPIVISLENCLFTGKISGTGANQVGGILGGNNSYLTCYMYNCLSVGSIETGAVTGGALNGKFNSQYSKLYVYDCYTTITNYGDTATASSSNTVITKSDDIVKTREELIYANETALFPTLTDETENAWVQDPYWNETDRGTPILAYFAEWWLGRQSSEGVSQRIDTSWYNDTDTTFTLTTAEQLLGLAELAKTNAFAGKTVKLGANIQLNEVNESILQAWKAGTQVPASTWTPIGNSTTPFAGTFDGQGYTISGLYYNGTGSRVGLFGSTNDQSELKNIKVVDSYFKTTGDLAGAVAAETNAHTLENLYSNAYVSANSIVGGLIGRLVGQSGGSWTDYYSTGAGTKWTVKKAWFDGEVVTTSGKHYFGGIVGNLPNPIVISLENCLFTGKISGTGANQVGGILGGNNSYLTCYMYNCLSVGSIETGAVTGGALNGKFNSQYSKLYVYDCYTTITNYGDTATASSSNTVITKSDDIVKTREELIYADETALLPKLTDETENAWVEDPYYNTTDRGTPILAYFAEWWLDRQPTEGLSEKIDTSWYDDSETEFTLTKVSEVLGIAKLSNEGKTFEGKTIKLGEDIVLNTVDEETLDSWKDGTGVARTRWTPIGSETTPFAGTFDGQGYTISGLYLNTTTKAAGFFGATNAAIIKNFKLADSYMKTTADAIGLIGQGSFKNIENVYTNAYITSTANYVGGFIGIAYPVNSDMLYVRNSWFDGEIIQTTGNVGAVGGFVGSDNQDASGNRPKITFENCLSTGSVTGKTKVSGFYGWHSWGQTKVIKNCLVVADITSNDAVYGAYFGYVNTGYTATITTSYTTNDKVFSYATNYGTKVTYDASTLTAREDLLFASEETLFPKLTGETVNAWVDDAYYNATDRGTPILAYFAEWWLERQETEGLTQKVDTSWYTGNASTYTLTTAPQLMGLAELAKTNSFAGVTIKLGADITLNEVDATTLAAWKAGTTTPSRVWTPIGNATTPFAGTFDGQGNSIIGLYLNATSDAAGLFGTTAATAVIKDFELIDSYMKSTKAYLGMIGEGAFVKIENVYTNAIMYTEGNYVGGFIGRVMGAGAEMHISNCWFAGEIIQTVGNVGAVGGFVGQTAQSTSGDRPILAFQNCLNTGSLSGYNRVGGFIGWHSYGNKQTDNTFDNCLMVGSVTSDNSSANKGMFIGHADTSGKTRITNSYTTGDVVAQGGSVSAITYSQDVFKTATELQNAGVATLFPSSTAWKDVSGSTPVLKDFAN